ncbi:hypothetical protein HETIRDRAFT_115444 [Heterobasidion irregulare TC 32-1]|uniref:Uncharacterized protein n=1 Tax=Heterobasidion irregulare (strain TC 32-1) TaxID=747525 RepID=W4KJ73_HETIT|nr:uncharacterized protein HETIRDRAFT_115444 [Heterobasidion irregulare TC 32-1]ETW85116.1 hypothetical protein HETIRDRAFT_115444 [Heterobasidion irregulare TC 32-1]
MTLNYARDIYAKYILQAYQTCFNTGSHQVIPNTEHPLMNFFSSVVSGTAEDIDRWKRYTTLPARSLRIWQNLRSHPSVFEDVHVPKESKQKYMCSTSFNERLQTDLEQLISAVPLHIGPFPQAAFLVAQQQTSILPNPRGSGSAKRQSL